MPLFARDPSRTKRSPRPLAALAVALAALVVVGCSKKVAFDQIGGLLVAYPEGQRGTGEKTPSDLVVWPDVPNEVTQFYDEDTTTFIVHRSGDGAVVGQIFDYFQAGGYQMFRRESGGGYRRFTDFANGAYQRWPDRSYYGGTAGTLVLPPAQFFTFSDAAPPAVLLRGYVGRAVVSGLSSAGYPLTNLGELASGSAIPGLPFTGDVTPPDSLIDIRWDPVAGAAGYWVHVFQTRADIRTSDEAIPIGLAAPVAIGKVRDLFIGYFPAPLTAYKLGDPLPPGSRVLVYRVLAGLQPVLLRISAVDANGAMIASTGLTGDMGAFLEKINEVDRLRVYPLGALVVTPGRPPPPLLVSGPTGRTLEAIDSGVPGLTYFRRGAAQLRAAR
jgi:hypothetical protein